MTANQLLQETQEVLILNLMDYVTDMQAKYSELFKPPAPGIYLLNQTKPILKEGRKYYAESQYSKQIPLIKLDDVNEAVVDDDGMVVIPAYIMARKKKLLTAQPNLPVRALEIATLIVKEWYDSFLMHRPTMEYVDEIMEHLVPEARPYVENNYFERSCTRLINEVSRFSKTHNWNIYQINLRNTDLVIEKMVDYRIYQWTLEQEQKTFDSAWSE